jgi:transposase-like protein
LVGPSVAQQITPDVAICGLSAARIPWPVGRRGPNKSPVVYAGLAKAVRQESVTAVAFWWGVHPSTVSNWRRRLGVGRVTAGTRRLLSAAAADPENVAKRLPGIRAKANDPERCAKIGAAKRGKKRPRHVIEAMRRGRTGKPHSAETRAKMRAAHKARGTRPPSAGRPWTSKEDELILRLPTAEVAKRTGRDLRAVRRRQQHLRERQAGGPTASQGAGAGEEPVTGPAPSPPPPH